jgi:two-component system NtrC family response regulator
MPGTILLVEDHPISRRNVAGFLSRFGYHVVEAGTGEDAVELIREQDNFDVVITDLRMPGQVNGLDVLACQSRVCPGKGAILLTAFGSDQIKDQALSLGAVFMDKPVNLQELLQEVENFASPQRSL